ncbi:MgtC/SapB family protein [Sphingobacterium spiritivorum]|uniref:MgtC/SapB family protein n=1 Tax=Sphingobacterium spiritivorum TaxID=258 RepID=UPI003DA3FD56
MNTLDFTIRLALSLLLGASIGFERQWRQKSAGLRTNTLVSLGSTAFILLSISIGGDATGRVASYIISGIGFLGAGVIMKDGMSVQGLNTAATIWCSAAIGSLVGVGLYAEAVILSFFVVLIHLLMRPLGQRIGQSHFIKSSLIQTDYRFSIICRAEVENHIRILLLQQLGNHEKLLLKSLSSDDYENPQKAIITAEIHAESQQDSFMERVASLLTIEEKVMKVSWEIIGTQSDL